MIHSTVDTSSTRSETRRADLLARGACVAVGILIGVSLTLAGSVLFSKPSASGPESVAAAADPGPAAPQPKAAPPVTPPVSAEPPAAPVNAATARHVDLLKLVDPGQDTILGAWTLNGTMMTGRPSGQGGQPLIEIPYSPPQEYDFEVKFVRTVGNDTIDLVCSEAGRQFSFTVGGWENTIVAFGYIDGIWGKDNSSAKTSQKWISSGRHYTILVKVRKNGVEGYLDGALITSHKTDDFTEMTVYAWNALRDRHAVGICLGPDTTTTIESAQIIEINGEGKNLR